jgi:hypothetical protein
MLRREKAPQSIWDGFILPQFAATAAVSAMPVATVDFGSGAGRRRRALRSSKFGPPDRTASEAELILESF